MGRATFKVWYRDLDFPICAVVQVEFDSEFANFSGVTHEFAKFGSSTPSNAVFFVT
jgi:hypothetical protein